MRLSLLRTTFITHIKAQLFFHGAAFHTSRLRRIRSITPFLAPLLWFGTGFSVILLRLQTFVVLTGLVQPRAL